jgi:hypothetical protein
MSRTYTSDPIGILRSHDSRANGRVLATSVRILDDPYTQTW